MFGERGKGYVGPVGSRFVIIFQEVHTETQSVSLLGSLGYIFTPAGNSCEFNNGSVTLRSDPSKVDN